MNAASKSAFNHDLDLHSTKGVKAFGSKVLNGFLGHDVMTMSAALAFYTALSLAPLLVITLSVVGLLGESSQHEFIQQVQSLMGDQAATAINAIIDSAQKRPNLGNLAGIIGFLTLFFSASGVFAQLQASLNKIWEAEAKASTGAWAWIRKRLLSMGMVITLGFLAMVSLVASAALSFVFAREGQLWTVLNWIVSLAVFSAMFAVIFKFLPDAKLGWKNALSGGVVTAVLFIIGKGLIGIYLGKSAVGSAYGAAGSLVVLLAWVYYSAIIVFTGAEITRVLAAHEGYADAQKAQPPPQKILPTALRPQST